MGFLDIFKKNKKKSVDEILDLSLSNLKKGYFVDYDLKTWEVTAANVYDWGGGDKTHEWQLKCVDDMLFLEREEDDDVIWSIARKISWNQLGEGVLEETLAREEPPKTLTFNGTTYHLDESSGGHFLKDGQGPGKEFLVWDYVDPSGERFLSIEQWGEKEFEAAAGQVAEEYQFTNILPVT